MAEGGIFPYFSDRKVELVRLLLLEKKKTLNLSHMSTVSEKGIKLCSVDTYTIFLNCDQCPSHISTTL